MDTVKDAAKGPFKGFVSGLLAGAIAWALAVLRDAPLGLAIVLGAAAFLLIVVACLIPPAGRAAEKVDAKLRSAAPLAALLFLAWSASLYSENEKLKARLPEVGQLAAATKTIGDREREISELKDKLGGEETRRARQEKREALLTRIGSLEREGLKLKRRCFGLVSAKDKPAFQVEINAWRGRVAKLMRENGDSHYRSETYPDQVPPPNDSRDMGYAYQFGAAWVGTVWEIEHDLGALARLKSTDFSLDAND